MRIDTVKISTSSVRRAIILRLFAGKKQVIPDIDDQSQVKVIQELAEQLGSPTIMTPTRTLDPKDAFFLFINEDQSISETAQYWRDRFSELNFKFNP